MSSLQELAGHHSPCYSTLSLYHGSTVNYNVLFWIVISLALCYASSKQEGFCMVGFHSRLAKEGGERMSDYELLMIMLTVLSLVVVLITKERK